MCGRGIVRGSGGVSYEAGTHESHILENIYVCVDGARRVLRHPLLGDLAAPSDRPRSGARTRGATDLSGSNLVARGALDSARFGRDPRPDGPAVEARRR